MVSLFCSPFPSGLLITLEQEIAVWDGTSGKFQCQYEKWLRSQSIPVSPTLGARDLFQLSLIFACFCKPGFQERLLGRSLHGPDTWKNSHLLQSLLLLRPPCQVPCYVQLHPVPLSSHLSMRQHPTCQHPFSWEENAIT